MGTVTSQNSKQGNLESLSIQQSEGQIFIQTENVDYSPGETIKGTVYLNLKKQYGPSTLKINFKGREYCLRAIVYYAGLNQYYEYKPFKAKLDTAETILYTWDENIPNLQYAFPFVLNINSMLPGSCFVKVLEILGDISYHLEARLIPNDKKQALLKYNHTINIKQISPYSNIDNNKQKESSKFAALPDATASMKIEIEKLIYSPGETINLKMNFNNTKSKIKCKAIQVSLKQNIILQTGFETLKRYKITSREYQGIEAGQEKLGKMSIIIPNAETFTLRKLKESGLGYENLKKLVINENKIPTSISPTTNGMILRSIYFLEIKAIMSGINPKTFGMSFHIFMTSLPTQIKNIEIPKDGWNPIIKEICEMKSFDKSDKTLNRQLTASSFKRGNTIAIDDSQLDNSKQLSPHEFEDLKDFESRNLLSPEESQVDEEKLDN